MNKPSLIAAFGPTDIHIALSKKNGLTAVYLHLGTEALGRFRE
jgi:hypothetical protein